MALANTVCLDVTTAASWQQAIRTLTPGISCLSLFVGFEGDIAAAGAGTADHWIYESEDIGAVWRNPLTRMHRALRGAPVAEGSHQPGKPTAEVVAVDDAATFALGRFPMTRADGVPSVQ